MQQLITWIYRYIRQSTPDIYQPPDDPYGVSISGLDPVTPEHACARTRTRKHAQSTCVYVHRQLKHTRRQTGTHICTHTHTHKHTHTHIHTHTFTHTHITHRHTHTHAIRAHMDAQTNTNECTLCGGDENIHCSIICGKLIYKLNLKTIKCKVYVTCKRNRVE